MARFYLFLIPVCLLPLFSSCVVVQSPILGPIYTHVQYGGLVTTNVGATKVGTACSHGLFGIGWGDSSLETAKKNAGIEKVATVDYEATVILWVYGKTCTLVYGE